MDRNRLLLISAALAAIVLLAGGVLLGVQPQLSAARATESQMRSIDQQNEQLTSQLATLKSTASRMDEVAAKLATLQASVPGDAAIPAFLDQLNAAASASDVQITSITTSDASAYTSPAPATTTATTSTTGSTSTASPTSSPTASATPSPVTVATGPVAPLPATNPLITGADFSTIPVTVTIQGNYDHALAYLSALQHGRRLFLVNAVSQSGTGSDGSDPDWTFGGYIYALTNAATTASTASTTTSQAAGGD